MTIFTNAFPNHYKGPGQPAFLGTDIDKKFKIAHWWKKDKKGRSYLVSKIEEINPAAENKNEAKDQQAIEEFPI